MRIKQITVYEFEELSPKAKRKVIDQFHDINVDYEWWESETDYWKEKLEEYGFDSPEIYFSGFGSQGDGACFEFNGLDIDKVWTIYTKHNKVKHEAWLKFYLQDFHHFQTRTTNSRYSNAMTREIACYDYSNREYRHLDKEAKRFEEWLESFRIDLCREIYKNLENEYYGLISEEAIIETIKCNDYEFTENGKVA